MGLTSPQKTSQPEVPSIFQPNYNQATNLINSQTGKQTNPNSFSVSPGAQSALNQVGSIFNQGGSIPTATNYINSTISGGPSAGYNAATATPGGQTLTNFATGANNANPYQNYISSILNGQYLNPSSNPAIQGEMGALGTQFQQALNQGKDSINSQFAASGQSPTSSPREGALSAYDNNAMNSYLSNVSSLLGNNYTQGLSMIDPVLQAGINANSNAQGNQLSAADSLLGTYTGQEGNVNQVLAMLGLPTSVAESAGTFSQLPETQSLGQENQQNTYDQQSIQDLIALMSGTPVTNSTYGPSEFDNNVQGIGALLAGGGQAAGGYAKLAEV